MNQQILLLILPALLAEATRFSNWTTSIVCEHDRGHIKCPEGQIIEIGYALYHRSSIDICPHPAGNETCIGTNVLPFVEQDCNRQQSCYIDSRANRHGDPCYGIFKYLEVHYRCLDPRDDFEQCQESVQNLKEKQELDKQRIENLTDAVVRLRDLSVLTPCSMNDEPGWISVLSRVSASLSFQRNWNDYVKGFSDAEGNCWIGLANLRRLACCSNLTLRVDMRDWENKQVYAEYAEFSVKPASAKYQATFSGYSGTAGDSLSCHSGMEFATDRPGKGGWWYNSCHSANPTGIYYRPPQAQSPPSATGIHWILWKNSPYSMQKLTMKIRIFN